MLNKPVSRPIAILQAFLVTFLWATSWVLIKVGLKELPALTFAGLRYFLAFLCLLPLALHPARRSELTGLARQDWARLFTLGLLYYTLTQGAQFVSLVYLPAVSISLVLSFTPAIVALLGLIWLGEKPALLQWAGIVVALAGALLYFYPVRIPAGQGVGLLAVFVGLLSNSASSLLGRDINRSGRLPPLLVTVISMGIGGTILLASGILTQGFPVLDARSWGIVAWLAILNTAIAFTLWNQTLRTLSAMESSMINNTMLIQVAVLAWLFLGESLDGREIAGLVIAALGTLAVQVRKPIYRSSALFPPGEGIKGG